MGVIKNEDCEDKKYYKRVKVTETINKWTEKNHVQIVPQRF